MLSKLARQRKRRDSRARGLQHGGMQFTEHHNDYQALRDRVRDGDTIAVLASGAYGVALALGRMGPYGHVGLVRSVTIDGVTRQMVIEENPGGGRYRPLSHYRHSDFDIFSAPQGIDGRQASAEAVKLLEGLATYDWRDIARLARWGMVRLAASLFDDPMPNPAETDATEGRAGVICSALVTSAYKRAGWHPPAHTAWPSSLCEQLGQARLTYRPTV